VYASRTAWVALRCVETGTFLAVEPPPHERPLVAHGRADGLSLSTVFGVVPGGLLWARGTDSLLNVCADGQVCSGYRERDADPHLRRLVRPTPGSSFVMESVGSDASGPRRK